MRTGKDNGMLLLATAFIFILVIIMALLIRRNIQRVVKKKYGRVINAKVIKWDAISGQPTRYILEVEYQMNSIKKTKRFITSGKFARKYLFAFYNYYNASFSDTFTVL